MSFYNRQHWYEAVTALAFVAWTSYTGVLDAWQSASQPLVVPSAGPALVKWVSDRLIPPSSLPYNLTKPDDDCWGQFDQMRVVQALTRNKTGGFFIEAGALDGERLSNTLLLERRFGWSGLLVEPSWIDFPKLISKRRRAWALEACLSNTGAPFTTVLHTEAGGGSATVEDGLAADKLRQQQQAGASAALLQHEVVCVPVDTALRALGRTEVDFFSLDIEGPEMGVLAYIPWDLLDIKILLVENFMLFSQNPQMDQMRDLMESRGYIAMHLMIDWIFVKKDSEYAVDAENIIRRARRDIVQRNNNAHFPYND